MSQSQYERRDDESLLQVIVVQMDNLHSDVGDMKSTLKDLASAIVKLALVEERQGQTAVQLERAFKLIEKLEIRMSAIELVTPISKQTNSWVFNGVWAAAGVLALILLKSVGVL